MLLNEPETRRKPDELELAMAHDAACWAPFYHNEMEVIAIEEAVGWPPVAVVRRNNERERLRSQLLRMLKKLRRLNLI